MLCYYGVRTAFVYSLKYSQSLIVFVLISQPLNNPVFSHLLVFLELNQKNVFRSSFLGHALYRDHMFVTYYALSVWCSIGVSQFSCVSFSKGTLKISQEFFSVPWYSQICKRYKSMSLSVAKAILLNSLVYMIWRSLDIAWVVWYK